MERAIESVGELEGIVEKRLIDAINSMIGEYNGHLQSDIEEMISDNEDLEVEKSNL